MKRIWDKLEEITAEREGMGIEETSVGEKRERERQKGK
jgi:hypothetical protein